MLYRYERELIRRANTTDESILTLIKNSNHMVDENSHNQNVRIAARQRDIIASMVSEDLTKRILLPEDIKKAHENGILYFHNANYFIQPIFNSSLIDAEDILDNGTIINGNKITSPNSFKEACELLVSIIINVAAGQYGEQSIDIRCLSKYLKKNESELTEGIKSFYNLLSNLLTIKGLPPSVALFLFLDSNDPYLEYTSKIMQEILSQRLQNSNNSIRLIYVLDENNISKDSQFIDITHLAIECMKKVPINFISAKKMRENYQGNVFSPVGYDLFLPPYKDENGKYKFTGRFNQGIVSINLVQIAILADGNEEVFFKLLEERLELCYEALMCRQQALLGTISNISPIHWQNGAIARLLENEKIDKYLKNGYSTLALGYVGLNDMVKIMKKVDMANPLGQEFGMLVLKKLRKKCLQWKKESGVFIDLYENNANNIGNYFLKIDQDKFNILKDKTSYNNSCFKEENINDIHEKIKLDGKIQSIVLGDGISNIKIPEKQKDMIDYENLIKFMYENIQYSEIRIK